MIQTGMQARQAEYERALGARGAPPYFWLGADAERA